MEAFYLLLVKFHGYFFFFLVLSMKANVSNSFIFLFLLFPSQLFLFFSIPQLMA